MRTVVGQRDRIFLGRLGGGIDDISKVVGEKRYIW